MDLGETTYLSDRTCRMECAFRLCHPSMLPEEISCALGLRPAISWSVGGRKTTKGEGKEGTYDRTYWTTGLKRIKPGTLLGDAVAAFVQAIMDKDRFLQTFAASGGLLEFFVVWHGEGGFTIPCGLIAELARLRIDLSVDIYERDAPATSGSSTLTTTYGLSVRRKKLSNSETSYIGDPACWVQYCFRLWHPSMLPEEISCALGLSPATAWSVGGQRKTPKGVALGGTYDRTYWLSGSKRIEPKTLLQDAVAAFVETIEDKERFLQKFEASGGVLELFVGWHGQGGFTIPCGLTAELARLRIDLSLDIYELDAPPASGP